MLWRYRQLCDSATGKGVLRCYPNNSGNGCPGANGNNCQPNVVWSGTYQTAGTNYYYGNLNSGTFGATTGHYANYTNAYSVRCVLDLNSNPTIYHPTMIARYTEPKS